MLVFFDGRVGRKMSQMVLVLAVVFLKFGVLMPPRRRRAH
jgi:hypothetical protein